MKTLFTSLFALLSLTNAFASSEVKLVNVFKGERRLELVGKDDKVIKSYSIVLGKDPIGHKVQEGDNKTPEGTYTLDWKKPNSDFHKAIHVSYPNKADKQKAKELGVSPGGSNMIHGYPNSYKTISAILRLFGVQGYYNDALIYWALGYFDWTSGCISVNNADINEIYSLVDVPTKIIIWP